MSHSPRCIARRADAVEGRATDLAGLWRAVQQGLPLSPAHVQVLSSLSPTPLGIRLASRLCRVAILNDHAETLAVLLRTLSPALFGCTDMANACVPGPHRSYRGQGGGRMLGPTTSLLVWAAIHDSCAAAATLLGAKASVNCVDDTGRTPLIWAAAYGHDAVMDVLVDAKADLRPSDHTTALHKAVVRDSVAAVSLLLNKCKAHVDCVNRLHDTPLVYAAEHGNARMVALLVEAKAAVDWDDGTDRTPLVRALWKKHVDVAAVLLLQGKADIKWRNCVLWDPLHHAAENGLVSIMSILVQLGADVESRDCQGRTPLYRAVRGDGRAALSALLKYKADVNVVDRDGVSPLSVAWRADVAAQLLEAKADVHQRDVQGRTVLHQVPPMRTEPIVALLLQAGADAETPDGQGRVPVAYAVDGGCTAALRTLLRCKASANKSFGATGCTPLCYAAQHGRPKEVSVLLEAKAHVNVPDSTGRTPLSYASESYAAERVKADLVKLLVQAGADVCCADDAARASCTAP